MHRALIWFKRDLRTADHAPLAQAAQCETALALFIIEPAWLGSPECHPRHVDWLMKCLAPLRDALASRGLALLVRTGDAVQVLSALSRDYAFTHLLSHEETGPGWSYDHDRAVARWCQSNQVTWTEYPQTGVVRRLKDRRGWAARWQARMDASCVPTPQAFRPPPRFSPSEVNLAQPSLRDLGIASTPDTPAGGEAAGLSVLDSFLVGRALGYRRHLSSPLTAQTGCSRLSEHFAFGTLSMRTVHQATEAAIRNASDRELAHGLPLHPEAGG